MEDHEFHVVEVPPSAVRVCHQLTREALSRARPSIAEDQGRLHHLAFRVKSLSEVDKLHSELKEIGATIVSPPQEYPEYTPPGYYALFFKDLEGIKDEIVCYEHKE